ncbi:probable serine/threonine-protein kinase DDB_G0282963 [Oppia nitens]|uniref:probable serine/threonine-protein kinase DDB_G0282963 n=1 Tax=Oppia nitens TaxID=1686743 RepID=UPI0023DC68A6|nr:probable serine/threonine-protein kinase DDB_G0282963 [Oppia nitens]
MHNNMNMNSVTNNNNNNIKQQLMARNDQILNLKLESNSNVEEVFDDEVINNNDDEDEEVDDNDNDNDDDDNNSLIDDSMDDIDDDDNNSLPSPPSDTHIYGTSYLSNESVDHHHHRNNNGGVHHHQHRHHKHHEDMVSEGSPMMGPLAQLQNALERHSGMLGMNLPDFTSTTNGTTPSIFSYSSDSMNHNLMLGTPTAINMDNDITGELYRCHLCSYSGTSKSQFEMHMNTHFDHKCPFCDYTSRTEGRLKRHVRDFHSEVPPDSWAGNRVLKENSLQEGGGGGGVGDDSHNGDDSDGGLNGSGSGSKSRKYKCKQCEFVATCKQEFWDHSKAHIKSEKLLTCPKCNFVTEYKHHLEYHLRNHFGSKPFKCAKCNYSCVNKSMLNSHMKSHSNIYQYRCADCSYATKYCHSLKLHLRKYQHKPATVLNLDGTPNPYPVIDVYGTRRGPRPKKPKHGNKAGTGGGGGGGQQNNNRSSLDSSSLPQTPIQSPISPNLLNVASIPPLIPASMGPMGLPFMYSSNPSSLIHNGLLGSPAMTQLSHQMSQSLFDMSIGGGVGGGRPKSVTSPNGNENYSQSPTDRQTNSSNNNNNKLKCNFCDFTAETRDLFGKHLLLHVAAENQDMCSRMYGMTGPTSAADIAHQNAILQELTARQSPDSRYLFEQITANPALVSTLLGMHSLPNKSDQQLLAASRDWHSSSQSLYESIGGSIHQRKAMTPPTTTKDHQSMATNDSTANVRSESAPIRSNTKNELLLSSLSSSGGLSPLHPRSRSSPSNSLESSIESTMTDRHHNQQQQQQRKHLSSHSESSAAAIPLDLSSNKSMSPLGGQQSIIDTKTTLFLAAATAAQQSPKNRCQSSTDEDKTADNESLRQGMGGLGGGGGAVNQTLAIKDYHPEPQPPQQQSRAQRRKGRASKLYINHCINGDDDDDSNDNHHNHNDGVVVDDNDNDDDDRRHRLLLSSVEERIIIGSDPEICVDSSSKKQQQMNNNGHNNNEEPQVDNIITKINSATHLLQEILVDMYSLKNDNYH